MKTPPRWLRHLWCVLTRVRQERPRGFSGAWFWLADFLRCPSCGWERKA